MGLILEFSTFEEAEQALSYINTSIASYWRDLGYNVTDDGHSYSLIGRNLKTKQNEPLKSKTVTWDDVKLSPDSTFYISSLTNTQYDMIMIDLIANFSFLELEAPDEWNNTTE